MPVPNFRRSNGARRSFFGHEPSPALPTVEDPFEEPPSRRSAHQRSHDRVSLSPIRTKPTKNDTRRLNDLLGPGDAAGSGVTKRKRGGGLVSQNTKPQQAAFQPFRIDDDDVYSINEQTVPDLDDPDEPQLNGDASLGQLDEDSVEDRTPSPPPHQLSSSARAALKKQVRKQAHNAATEREDSSAAGRKRGRPKRSSSSKFIASEPTLLEEDEETEVTGMDGGAETPEDEEEEQQEPPRKRSRTTKATAKAAVKTRTARQPAAAKPMAAPDPKSPRKVSKPKPKSKPAPKPAGSKSLATHAAPHAISSHIHGSQITRRHEASEEPEARATRSGRTVIKPLAFWKGECVEYADRRQSKGGSFVMGGIKEVLRTDEIVEERKVSIRKMGGAKKKNRNGGKKRLKREEVDAEDGEEEIGRASAEEEDDEVEEWEVNNGYVRSDVMVWDEEMGQLMIEDGTDVGFVENIRKSTHPERAWPPTVPFKLLTRGFPLSTAIAYAGDAIETRPVANCDFTMTKTISNDFFGAGLVDLPPGAVKHAKDPGVMQLVFFVASGRVTASVNGTRFGIGKGGTFQVPRGEFLSYLPVSLHRVLHALLVGTLGDMRRGAQLTFTPAAVGNIYAIENSKERPARLFFAQGSDLTADQRRMMKEKRERAEAEAAIAAAAAAADASPGR